MAAAKVRAGRDDVAGAENEKTILRRTPPRTLRTPPSTPPREGRPRFEGLSPRFDVGRGRGARPRGLAPRPRRRFLLRTRARVVLVRGTGARSRSHSIGASSSRARTSAPSSPAARASFASAFTVAPGARRPRRRSARATRRVEPRRTPSRFASARRARTSGSFAPRRRRSVGKGASPRDRATSGRVASRGRSSGGPARSARRRFVDRRGRTLGTRTAARWFPRFLGTTPPNPPARRFWIRRSRRSSRARWRTCPRSRTFRGGTSFACSRRRSSRRGRRGASSGARARGATRWRFSSAARWRSSKNPPTPRDPRRSSRTTPRSGFDRGVEDPGRFFSDPDRSPRAPGPPRIRARDLGFVVRPSSRSRARTRRRAR